MMKCDSPVGSDNTGCERSMYCSSVVPDRGAPTIKTGPFFTGYSCEQSTPRRRLDNAHVRQTSLQAPMQPLPDTVRGHCRAHARRRDDPGEITKCEHFDVGLLRKPAKQIREAVQAEPGFTAARLGKIVVMHHGNDRWPQADIPAPLSTCSVQIHDLAGSGNNARRTAIPLRVPPTCGKVLEAKILYRRQGCGIVGIPGRHKAGNTILAEHRPKMASRPIDQLGLISWLDPLELALLPVGPCTLVAVTMQRDLDVMLTVGGQQV